VDIGLSETYWGRMDAGRYIVKFIVKGASEAWPKGCRIINVGVVMGRVIKG